MGDDFSTASFSEWIGRVQSGTDVITPELVRRYNAIFSTGEDANIGDTAPPTIHWCLARPAIAADRIGEDGHPVRGLLLPPVPLQRRMWAGSTLTFIRPLSVGAEVRIVSRLTDIQAKTGGRGNLVFLTFAHEVHDHEGVALTETQDIVYLDPPPTLREQKTAPAPNPPTFNRSKQMASDPVMLFRYSAITFNGHRIHYDLRYSRDVEGYPGLVVHGPMQAALLLEFARENGRAVKRFSFRGKNPLFCGTVFTLIADDSRADRTELAILDEGGATTMSALVTH